MDLYKIIQNLYAEKERLEGVIASLEALAGSHATEIPKLRRGKRGRKSMGPNERLEVSARMKNYWASRRNQPTPREDLVSKSVNVLN